MTVDVTANVNGVLHVRTFEPGWTYPHRRAIAPGYLEAGVWVDTDVSGEHQDVQDAAASVWTDAVKAAYEARLRELFGA